MRLSVEPIDTNWPPQRVAVMATKSGQARQWAPIQEFTGPMAVIEANRAVDRLRAGALKVDWRTLSVVPV